MSDLVIAACAKLADPKLLSAIALFCLGVLALHRLLLRGDNPLTWWHFISTRGADGNHFADLDKLGKMVGIVVASWVMVVLAGEGKMDAAIFAVYLAFVGAVAGYSAYLRTRLMFPPPVPVEAPVAKEPAVKEPAAQEPVSKPEGKPVAAAGAVAKGSL